MIFLIAFFVVLSASFIGYFYTITHKPSVQLPIMGDPAHKVRDFSFTNQAGQNISQATTKGKIYVVEYFFATCKGICPKMNENLNSVYQQFKGNPNVLFLSHTVDPEEDSVAALAEYAKQFEADPKQWHFLTGDKKQLYDQARYSYLISALDDTAGVSIDQDFIHDNHFVLVDRHNRIRGMYDGLQPNEMLRMIKDMQMLLKTDE